jgi:hypothetical protein
MGKKRPTPKIPGAPSTQRPPVQPEQTVNIDTIIMRSIENLTNLGALVKNDKTRSEQTIEALQKKIQELEKGK